MARLIIPLFIIAAAISMIFLMTSKKSPITIPEPIPMAVLDYIHQPKLQAEFLVADRLKYRLDYQNSADSFKAVFNSRKLQNLQDSFYCLNQLAYLNLCMYRDSDALHWIKLIDTLGGEKRMEHPGAKGDYFFNKGTWGYNTGNLEKVPEYYKNAISNYKRAYLKEKPDTMHHRIGQARVKLGLFYLSFKTDSAYSLIMDAFDYYQSPMLHAYQGEAFLAYAILCRWEREYDKSIEYAIKAREISKNQPFVDTLSLCRTYVLETYLKGARNTDQKEVDSIKYDLMAKNDTFLDLFQKLKSVRRFELLSDYFLSIHPKIYRDCATPIFSHRLKQWNTEDIGLGKTFFRIDYLRGFYFEKREIQIDSSIKYYTLLLNSVQKEERYPFPEVELGIQALADYLKQQRRYNDAIKCNATDILLGTSFLKNYTNKSVHLEVFKSPKLLNDKKYLFYSFGMRGNIYASRYKNNNKIADLDSAFHFYKLVDSLFFPKVVASDEEAILRYHEEVGADIYNNAIEVIFELYSLSVRSKLKKKYIQYALQFVEHRKAFLLYQTLNSRSRVKYNKNERNLLDSLKKLGSSDLNSDIIRSKIESISRKLRPVYLKHSKQSVSLEEIMDYLPKQTTFVHYIVADSFTFILQIDKHNYSFLRTKVQKKELDSLILKFRQSITKYSPKSPIKPSADYLRYNNYLYDNLVLPVLPYIENCSKLIISPDGYLALVPFDALMRRTSKPINSWENAPFLIKSFNIVYTPAWKIYSYGDKRNSISIKNSKNMLAMAYGRKEDRFRKPAIELNNTYPQTILRTGWLCKKTTAKKLMPKQEVTFLSMHGTADINDPDRNRLLFSTDREKATAQDFMTGLEIALMKLDSTKLIALSSCETSIGKNNPAEGTFSITRSFLQAGSKCVIGALWETPTNANTKIFNDFWMNSKKYSVEESLFAAKRQFLKSYSNKDAAKLHPYVWAGLIVTR